jgi:exopolysaccharide biosynthesis polyprenyl glycosylphosphotransferase
MSSSQTMEEERSADAAHVSLADDQPFTDPIPAQRTADERMRDTTLRVADSSDVTHDSASRHDEVAPPAPRVALGRASDAAPLFPPTDVPLLKALPYAQADPVTRLRRVLSAGDLVAASVVGGICLINSLAAGMVAVAVLLLALLSANDNQHPSHLLSGGRAAKRSMVAVGLVSTVQVVLDSRMGEVRPMILAMAVFASMAVAWRLLLRVPPVQRLFRSERYESVLLIGDFPTVASTIRRWTARKAATRIAGVLLTDAPDGVERRTEVEGVRVFGQLKDAAPAACDLGVSKVVVVGETVHSTTLRRIGWELDKYGIPVAVAMRIEGIRPHRSRVDIVGDQTVVELEAVHRRGVVNMAWAVADRLLAVILLLLFLPFLIMIGVGVRLDSPGPALFKQARAGRFGKPFMMVKFRSMTTDAEELKGQLADLNETDGVFFKIRQDPRVTRIGAFLRSTSLDELPQLWNVVRGDMSLIGPRPHVIAEADAYDAWAQRRLMVKPGLTGLWQVSGRSNLGWEEAVLHDLDYVDNWRPGLDLGIAFRTLGAVFRRDGAY